jgi:hypothetical protein
MPFTQHPRSVAQALFVVYLYTTVAASTKVAVSLDRDLFAHADRVRADTGESRSALFARALRALLATEARAKAVAQYVQAYRDKPETAEEVRAMRAASKRALATVPWDDE